MNENEMRELVRRKTEDLGEHCDCVIVLVTWQHNGETFYVSDHTGNAFAHNSLLETYYAESQESEEEEEEYRDEWEKED